MDSTSVNSQEKLAAMLSYLLFFLPILMNQKTEYVGFHMKQSFGIFLILLANSIILNFFFWLPIIGWVLRMIPYVVFIGIAFLAYQAYTGNKFTVQPLIDLATKVISTLNMTAMFESK